MTTQNICSCEMRHSIRSSTLRRFASPVNGSLNASCSTLFSLVSYVVTSARNCANDLVLSCAISSTQLFSSAARFTRVARICAKSSRSAMVFN